MTPLSYNIIIPVIKKEFKLSTEEFDQNGINVDALFSSQNLQVYQGILEGSVYPNILADFWMFASLRIDSEGKTTIVSQVCGSRITISPSFISEVLRCENSGEVFVDNSFSMSTSSVLRTIMANNPFSTLVCRIWHQLLVGNFRPRNEDQESIMVEDLEFMLCALRGKKINIPLMIFKHLTEAIAIAASRQGKPSCLPYARLLSHMFIKQGLVKKLRTEGFLDPFEAESLPLLNLEGLQNRIN